MNFESFKARRSPASQNNLRRLLKVSCCGSDNSEASQLTVAGMQSEVSLEERGPLNFEVARALLGKIEYENGNIGGALHVFEGIDFASATPKILSCLSDTVDARKKQQSTKEATSLLEAMLMKVNSLQFLCRREDAAQSCKMILDIVESSFPLGFPENFDLDDLKTTVVKTVELLPELWKSAGFVGESMTAYRRALSRDWGLASRSVARIEMELCLVLLYGGHEARSDSRSNLEEAIGLLMTLLRKAYEGVVDWECSVLDHLCFALAVSSETKTLAAQLEMLVPGFLGPSDGFYLLSLCYYAAGESSVALNLLKKLLHAREDPENIPALLLASKICCDRANCAEEGIMFCERALSVSGRLCKDIESVAMFLLGVSLSCACKFSISHREREAKETAAMEALEHALRMGRVQSADMIYHLAVENACQMNLDTAKRFAREVLDLEKGSSLRGWLLLSKILSAQKEFASAEMIVNAALDQTNTWDQGELLKMKAKLQISKGEIADAIQSYILLASLKIQRKNIYKDRQVDFRRLETEFWHDLASLYLSVSRWSDAEICIGNSKIIDSCCAARIHICGLLTKEMDNVKDALKYFVNSMNVDPYYVPSLMSTATALRELGHPSNAVAKSFVMESLRQDRKNWLAWHNLGLIHRDAGGKCSSIEAANCFQVAVLLQESAPIDPF